MADDECSQQCLGVPNLEKEGHLVLFYRNGKKIIDDVEDGLIYHIGIIDLSLPGIGGYDVISRLKEKYPLVPIICSTGYSLANTDADAIIVKPWSYFDLAKKINQLLPGTIKRSTFLDFI